MSLARAITTSTLFSSTLGTLILQEIIATEAADMLLQQLKAMRTADLWVAGGCPVSTEAPEPEPTWRPHSRPS